MPRVHVLSEDVASQIAAGEVVERPASAVRELVENSLDAGARQIRVEIAGGGLELVRVADDGCGMEEADCLLALRPHATSKISEASDLFAITSLGFRGEALPSLAAVSRLSITSRRRDDVAATRVEVEAGEVRQVASCGRAPGTTIEAADLFFNTPARQKFLSSPAREAALISEVAGRYAMAHPGVHFILESRGRSVFNLPPAASRAERLAACLGRQSAADLIAAHEEGEPLILAPGIGIEAYLGPPELARTSARAILFFLNGRPIRDRVLLHALMRAYEGLLTSGQYPQALIFLTVEPSAVDVNVHPAKAEVRFREHRRLADLLTHALRPRLERRGPGGGAQAAPDAEPYVKRYVLEAPAPTVSVASPQAAYAAPLAQTGLGLAARASAAQAFEAEPVPAAFEPGRLPESFEPTPEAAPGLRFLGQLLASYLLCEEGGALVVIDQHAAHERVLFEELEEAASSGRPGVQELLFPAVVELDARQARTLASSCGLLAQAGLIAEPFGGRSAAVKGLPQGLGALEPASLLREALDRLEDRAGGALDARRHALLSLLACKGAIKAGQALSAAEARALVARTAALRLPYCPHGRPVMRRIPVEELARLFKR
jgi:DNA mismatch repair protein MutL